MWCIFGVPRYIISNYLIITLKMTLDLLMKPRILITIINTFVIIIAIVRIAISTVISMTIDLLMQPELVEFVDTILAYSPPDLVVVLGLLHLLKYFPLHFLIRFFCLMFQLFIYII